MGLVRLLLLTTVLAVVVGTPIPEGGQASGGDAKSTSEDETARSPHGGEVSSDNDKILGAPSAQDVPINGSGAASNDKHPGVESFDVDDVQEKIIVVKRQDSEFTATETVYVTTPRGPRLLETSGAIEAARLFGEEVGDLRMETQEFSKAVLGAVKALNKVIQEASADTAAEIIKTVSEAVKSNSKVAASKGAASALEMLNTRKVMKNAKSSYTQSVMDGAMEAMMEAVATADAESAAEDKKSGGLASVLLRTFGLAK